MFVRTLISAAVLTALSAAAWAGPCSDDIAAIGRQLADKPQLGPPVTGTLTGSNTGPATAGQAPAMDKGGTTASANQRIGGTAGTKELNAAATSVATSPEDVQRQQLGKPTAAQEAAAHGNGAETAPGGMRGGSTAQDDHVSRAKTAWQQAVDLNASNDSACKGAIQRAQAALHS